MHRPGPSFARFRSRRTRTALLISATTLALVTVPMLTSAPSPAPTATAAPTRPTPTPTNSVRVTSIPALLTTLADNTVDEIVVANGTYQVSPASRVESDSLWIGGDRFANRTLPITVRAETIGGVTFDGSGASGAFGGLSFEDGAHHQTWDGFRFANMTAVYTGIIEVGGYTPRRTPHHITIRNMTIPDPARVEPRPRAAVPGTTGVPRPRGRHGATRHPDRGLHRGRPGNLASAIHIYHGDAANPGA